MMGKDMDRGASAERMFQRGLARLEQYVGREGHSNPPPGHRESGFNLGSWVYRRRREHREGRLPEAWASALERFPGWVWDPGTATEADGAAPGRALGLPFFRGIQRVTEYIQREGHCRISEAHEEEDGYALGRWVARMRRMHKTGALDVEKTRMLEAVPGWTWTYEPPPPRGLDEDLWWVRYGLLKQWAEENGHASPPRPTIVADGVSISNWAWKQRNHFLDGLLSEEMVQALESLPGWSWRRDPEGRALVLWSRNAATLKATVEKHGGWASFVAMSEADDDTLLRWIDRQVAAVVDGTLNEDDARIFLAIPGAPEVVEAARANGGRWLPEPRWIEGMRRWRRHTAATGSTWVKLTEVDADGHGVGRWAYRMRHENQHRTISPIMKEILDALPGWPWIDGFERIRLLGLRRGPRVRRHLQDEDERDDADETPQP